MKKGFTLTELMIVVLIVGILAAIALPKYQTVVDESRYSTLMPLAKSLATSQESFYMANGRYSEDLSELNVELPGENVSGYSATFGNGVNVEISDLENYDYVKMSSMDLKNNYIIYLTNSRNYANEIHCEALKDDNRAQRLCEDLDGQLIEGNLTEGYDTYVLEGNGTGVPASLMRLIAGAPEGWQECESYPCTKTCDRETADGYSCEGTYKADTTFSETVCAENLEGGRICISIEYDDKGHPRRQSSCVQKPDSSVCEPKQETLYDEHGHITLVCTSVAADGSCKSGTRQEYTYDENGNTVTKRLCLKWDGNGTCTQWGADKNNDYAYDANANMTSNRSCGDNVDSDGNCTAYRVSNYSADFTYDNNGNLTSTRKCLEFEGKECVKYGGDYYYYNYDTNGKIESSFYCKSWSGLTCTDGSEYTYDEKGNILSERKCKGNVTENLTCGAYSTGSNSIDYTYDAYGRMASKTTCEQYQNNVCTSFKTEKYTYDEFGRVDTKTNCAKASNTDCSNFTAEIYGYDSDGNKTSVRACGNGDYNSTTGNCQKYLAMTDFTYDADGHVLTKTSCKKIQGTTCEVTKTEQTYDYTYDANGKLVSMQGCKSYNDAGTCTSYDSKEYTYGIGTGDAREEQQAIRSCTQWSGDTCIKYSGTYNYDTYDADGNKVATLYCREWSGTTCVASKNNPSIFVTYDENGNVAYKRSCDAMNSQGECTTYHSGQNNDYVFDNDGNMTSIRSCSGNTIDGDGNCTAYRSNGDYSADYTYNIDGSVNTKNICNTYSGTTCTKSTYYTYGTNGTVTNENKCNTWSGNTCTKYESMKEYVYDENGNKLADRTCKKIEGTACTKWNDYGNYNLANLEYVSEFNEVN